MIKNYSDIRIDIHMLSDNLRGHIFIINDMIFEG